MYKKTDKKLDNYSIYIMPCFIFYCNDISK